MPFSVPKRGEDDEKMVWGNRHSLIATAWMFSGLLAFTHATQAATTVAQQAGEMLARAQALNQKCNYLNAADKAHLLRLVQKAEHALTMRANADIAGAAMRHGREAGADSDCSVSEKKNLKTILGAAKAASDSAGTEVLAPEPIPPLAKSTAPGPRIEPKLKPAQAPPQLAEELVTPAEPKPKQIVAKVPRYTQPAALQVAAVHPMDSGLQSYGEITRDYYVARRCAPNDAKGLGQMYQQIVARHDALLRDHAAGEISSILRRSASEARGQGC